MVTVAFPGRDHLTAMSLLFGFYGPSGAMANLVLNWTLVGCEVLQVLLGLLGEIWRLSETVMTSQFTSSSNQLTEGR